MTFEFDVVHVIIGFVAVRVDAETIGRIRQAVAVVIEAIAKLRRAGVNLGEVVAAVVAKEMDFEPGESRQLRRPSTLRFQVYSS